ncbi:hypothetical protein MHBO_004643 [Bonamia ostreae]|uniref:Uncharacterized protein n=1 Tax=Bonamia ostreae TaxID=126728 RepID=A0ABV2ATX8_9EUKA
MTKDYNITKWRCSLGSIIFDIDFADRESFLKFQKDMKDGDLKKKLLEVIVFEPLMEQLECDLEKKDFCLSLEDVQENRESLGDLIVLKRKINKYLNITLTNEKKI